VAAGVVALSLAIVASHCLWAQGTNARPSAPAPTTKVALLNLTYVLRHYERGKTFSNEMKEAVKPFQDKDTSYKKSLEGLAKEAQDAKTTAERREQIEQQAKRIQRDIEDNKLAAQKTLGKRQGEQLKIIYMDIHGVVQRIATSHGYDIVLQFHDALTPEDYWSPANIERKLRNDGLVAMYYNPALDISQHVVTTLNGSLKNGAGAAGGSSSRR
jgi:Skp family chaperone for outer membrane proteins